MIGILGVVLLYIIGLRLFDNNNSAFGSPRITIENPDQEFTKFTGLAWPDGATVIAADTPYSAPFGEGEFYLIFETNSEVIKDWLSKPPPWEAGIWKYGPIPPEIGLHITLGTSGVGIQGNGSLSTYFGDEQLVQLLNSRNNLYAINERCCNGNPGFNNGNLLIIEPGLNKVWLVIWDS